MTKLFIQHDGVFLPAGITLEEVERQKADIEKMKCCGNCNKAKEIIKKLIDSLECIDGEQVRELKAVKEAEEFIKE